MKITRLEISNFLTIGRADLELDGKGLVLLQGVNNDDTSATSNGAGKSSIPDALCWALFGTTARGESTDAIVNDKAKKDCVVQVIFIEGATQYKVTRYRKHSKFKNELHFAASSGPSTPFTELTRGTSAETQDSIEKAVGCNLDVFKAAIYCGQESMPDLPGMTDKQLKILVEQAAGIERLERAYEVARAHMNAVDREHEALHAKVLMVESQIDSTETEIRGLEKDLAEWVFQHDAEIETKTAAATKVEQQFRTLAETFKTTRKPAELESKLAVARKGLETYSAAQAAIPGVRSRLSASASVIARREATARTIGESIKSLRATIEHMKGHGPGGCSACGAPLDAKKHEAVVALRQGEVDGKAIVFKQAMAELNQAKDIHELIVSELEALEAVRAAPELLDEIQAYEEDLRVIQGEREQLQRLLVEHKTLLAELAALKIAKNPIDAPLTRARHRLDQLHKQHIEAADLRAKKREAVEIAIDCVKVFGPAGVRAHVLDTVTPFLNERTADYLTVLADGNLEAVWTTLIRNKAGELKEKFSIEVRWRGGRSFGLISGGQKRKARLACILALQDLVASRATKPIDLWIGDEIDDALDSAGLERLMTILESRARERGTVLVVSHNELRDWIDNVTTITLDGGFSTVTGALCA